MIKAVYFVWGLVALNVGICAYFTIKTRELQEELQEANMRHAESMMKENEFNVNRDLLIQRITETEEKLAACRDSLTTEQ